MIGRASAAASAGGLGRLLSQERIDLLNSWRRSGFSVHNRVFVDSRDGREVEALVRYRMRSPVSLSRLH